MGLRLEGHFNVIDMILSCSRSILSRIPDHFMYEPYNYFCQNAFAAWVSHDNRPFSMHYSQVVSGEKGNGQSL